MTGPTENQSPMWSRIALAGAAIIALIAIGFAVTGPGQKASIAREAAPPAQQPDAAAMIPQLESRLRDEPNNAEGWQMLGQSNFDLGRYGKAVEAYRRATALVPGEAAYWSALGEALILAGDQSIAADAKNAFDKAIAADPADPRARYFLAAAKEQAGDHTGAIDDWIALLKDSPDGAPWVQSLRSAIEQVASTNNIDVSGRLPASTSSSVATNAIPGPTAEQIREARTMSPAEQNAMARRMVDSLATKLRSDPKNPEGWIRLMRARKVLGDEAGAAQALVDARAAYASDASQKAAFDQAAQTLGIAER